MKFERYLIYQHQSEPQIQFVRDGFSFRAAIFSGLWLMYHGVWYVLLASIAVLGILNIIINSFHIEDFAGFLLSAINFLFFGFFNSDILEWHYKRLGYKLEDIVFAYSPEEAELKFYEKLRIQNV